MRAGRLGAAAAAVRDRGLEQVGIVGRRSDREIVRLLGDVLERARELRAVFAGERHARFRRRRATAPAAPAHAAPRSREG